MAYKAYEFDISASTVDDVTMTHTKCGEIVLTDIDPDLSDLMAAASDHVCPEAN